MPNENQVTAHLEISKIPRRYLEYQLHQSDEEQMHGSFSSIISGFARFLGAMMYSNQDIGFRIMCGNGQARMFYLIQDYQVDTLSLAFKSQFPEFELSHVLDATPKISGKVCAAEIRGVPLQVPRSLDGLVESMLQSHGFSMYQVLCHPKRPGYLSRKRAERKYKSTLEKMQSQETFQHWLMGQGTQTRYDVDSLHSKDWHKATYDRMSADRLLDCHVIIAFWGHQLSQVSLNLSMNTLLATISHSGKKERLRTRVHEDEKALRLITKALDMSTDTKATPLLPREAVPFFEIPHIETGLTQSSTTSFSTADTTRTTTYTDIPFQQGQVALGCVYRNGQLWDDQIVYLESEALRRHTAILGMTGSGKSTTKKRFVIDAWKNGISSLLIEPVKSDTRDILQAIPEARVFTVGREPVAPFRLNPFLIDDKVPVQPHIDQVYFTFLAAWPLYGILTSMMRNVILGAYVSNGWDVVHDLPGKNVSIYDLHEEAKRYWNQLVYGSEMRQDFRGAILTRLKDLCDPSRAAILNAKSNLSISELLSVPTIIELGYIKDPEFKALILNFILNRIEQYMDQEGPAERIRGLIMIDEAHRFLGELPPAVDMSEVGMSKRQAQDQLENLVAEARSGGFGMVILDQDPTQLSRRVLKNCHTKIIHRLDNPEDTQLAALLTRCNQHQAAHIGDMKDGEAVLRRLRDNVPLNIQVFYDAAYNPDMKLRWTDDDIRAWMKPFYDSHPEFAITPEAPILGGDDEQSYVSLRVEIEDIVRSHGYRNSYLSCVNDPDAEKANSIEELVVYYSTRVVKSERPTLEVVRVFIEVSEQLYGPVPYTLNPLVIQELISEFQQAHQLTTDWGDSLEP